VLYQLTQIEKGRRGSRRVYFLLAIDAFSEINIIEDDLLLGFVYLVDYPILPHPVFPETFQFANFANDM
jgi:hypothetical protein